eukprot:3938337-Rhodomonas_salina.2
MRQRCRSTLPALSTAHRVAAYPTTVPAAYARGAPHNRTGHRVVRERERRREAYRCTPAAPPPCCSLPLPRSGSRIARALPISRTLRPPSHAPLRHIQVHARRRIADLVPLRPCDTACAPLSCS